MLIFLHLLLNVFVLFLLVVFVRNFEKVRINETNIPYFFAQKPIYYIFLFV